MKFKSHICSEKMHFESAAEIMSKGNSSYKDLFWHAKTSNSKDPLPAQSSLLSSLQSCCTTSIVGLLTLDELRVNSETPEGKIPSVRTNRESQAQPGTKVSEQSPQLHLSTAGHSRWQWLKQLHQPRPAHWHPGQPKYNQTLADIPQSAKSSILQVLCSL